MDKTESLRDSFDDYEYADDVPTSKSAAPTIGDVINARMGRRDFVKGSLGVAAVAATVSPIAMMAGSKDAQAAGHGGAARTFKEIAHGVSESHVIADGYDADILIRWGDPVEADAPTFDPNNQTPEAQAKQFGYNNDYIGFWPINADETRAVLCVNHEYTNEEVMFPGVGRQDRAEPKFGKMTRQLIDIEMAAHGGSVLEIEKGDTGKWAVVQGSPLNRRIHVGTEIMLSGPAAGHDRLKTSADPTGTKVLGTINNCAGGMTPWGTYLMAEENFHGYFKGKSATTYTVEPGDTLGSIAQKINAQLGTDFTWGEIQHLNDLDDPNAIAVGQELKVPSNRESVNYARYGVGGHWYDWGSYHDRFDVEKELNEANRFGWVVEVDPEDPTSIPIKRTAMGRFKHEGAETILDSQRHVVSYMGDDQRFDFVYRYRSNRPHREGMSKAEAGALLDDGILSVARFDADGTVQWMPLVFGRGPLTPANGFFSQADVMIETRRAADLLGATPMDRPEDVEANPKNGNIYVMLTNNSRRKAGMEDAANPRADNIWGQIVEIQTGNDHAGATSRWEILVACGNPAAGIGASWNPATSENGWFSCPDNCAIDNHGRLWVTTDQGGSWSKASGTADGVWALETEGAMRGTGKMFFRVPVGAEMCGPKFTKDDETLFVAVQHPATDGTKDFEPFGKSSTFEDPATRWPDFQDGMPPRPSVVQITKQGGGVIGS